MSLPDGIARHLDASGLVTYSLTGGDCFIDRMPPEPDQAVAITQYAGPEADTGLGYDEPSIQVRVRGTQDPTVSRDRAQAIYDALHGLGHITLPDGTEVIDVICTGSGPVSMGVDGQGRHEHVVNFRTEIRRTTTNRE